MKDVLKITQISINDKILKCSGGTCISVFNGRIIVVNNFYVFYNCMNYSVTFYWFMIIVNDKY